MRVYTCNAMEHLDDYLQKILVIIVENNCQYIFNMKIYDTFQLSYSA